MNLPDPEQLKRRDEIDKLVSRANYLRMRQEFDQAEEISKQILELEPTHPLAREWAIDALYQQGKLEEAAAEYKKLLEEDPSNAQAEIKYAKITLEIAEQEREKAIMQEMLENPQKFIKPNRSPAIAFILSLVLPGFGHFYLKEIVRGSILTGSFILCIIVLAFSSGTEDLIRQITLIFSMGYGFSMDGPRHPIGVVPALFAAFLAFTYIYAIIDAPIIATKSEQARSKEEDGKVSN